MADATESTPTVGQLLDGRYEILREIATGGMSVVYEAKHVRIGRRVAIKVLHRELAGDVEVVGRFLNEARAVGTFGHPNIVASTDFGELPGHVPYLVLEYLEGHNLSQEIAEQGPLPLRRLARIAAQIASALEAAHARNVIHRDLTSANIFLVKRPGNPDHVKVLDFGISKFLEASDSAPKTRRGLTMGTPEFMAPEQIADPDSVDSRADIYALGVILYQMLDGRYPFTRSPLQALLTQIVVEPPPPIARQGVPEDLHAVMHRALAKNPADRYPTMREMGADLERFAHRITSHPFQAVDDLPRRAPVLVSGGRDLSPADDAPATKTLPPGAVPRVTPGGGVVSISDPSTARVPTQKHGVIGSSPSASRVQAAAHAPSGGGNKKLTFAALAIAIGAAAGLAVLLLRQPSAPPLPAPVAAVPPAPAPPPPAPAPIHLDVTSATPDARVTLRGRTQRLPLSLDITAGSQPEIVELTAPGHEGHRFWITFDRPVTLSAELPVGKGVTEASAEETVVALGGQPIAATKPAAPVKEPSRDEATPLHRSAGGARRSHPEPAGRPGLAKATRPSEPARAPSEAPREASPPAPTPAETTAESSPKPAAPALEAKTAPAAAAGPNGAGTAAKPRAPAAPPTPGSGTAPAVARGLDPAKTQAVVRSRLPEVQRCFERGKMDAPDLRGRVTLKISVSPVGAVTSVAVESSSLRSSAVESCLVTAVQSWKFPAPVGGPAVISYPFNFR